MPLAEIGVGQPIGEIAFFAGGLRTATVVAVRDSVVLELDRASFEDVARRVPAIYDKLLAAMAQRLAETTARITGGSRVAAARTVTIVTAGHGGVPAAFFDRLRSAFASSGRCLFLSHADLKGRFPDLQLEDPTILNWLNAIESEYELVVYLTDEEPTNWTHTALRQADQVVLVAYGAAAAGLNRVEDIALAVHPANRRRFVRVHDRRMSYTTGTAEWLRTRDVTMSHHVSLEDNQDLKRLYRFLTGQAVGFVAGGGGGSAGSRRHLQGVPGARRHVRYIGGRERRGGGARGLCFAAHAGRARSRAQGHLRLQPRVQTAHVSPLCAARPRRIRQGIATAVPRRADRRRMDTLLRGRHRRRPGRPKSLCHAPRGAVEGGARVRLDPGGAAAHVHRRRANAGRRRGRRQHSRSLP